MNQKLIFLFCLGFQPFLFSIGAGAAFYRYNSNGDLEFLLVRDPHYIGHKIRSGFEFPGGVICDHPAIDYCDARVPITMNNPKTVDMAYGGFREALEETCFTPVVHSNLKINNPYDDKLKQIDTNNETDAVNAMVQMSRKQGGMYLFKNNSSGAAHPSPDSRNACFLCDITNIIQPKFLKAIVVQKQWLLNKGFNMDRIGAEPDAFAWISGAELLKVINLASAKGKPLDLQERLVIVNQLTPLDPALVDNQTVFATPDKKSFKVALSNACVGMNRDRVGDPTNPQPDELHRHDGQPSSMRAILQYLMMPHSPKHINVVPVAPKVAPKVILTLDQKLQAALTAIQNGVYDNEIVDLFKSDARDAVEMFQVGFLALGDDLRGAIVAYIHPIAKNIRDLVDQKIAGHRTLLAKNNAKKRPSNIANHKLAAELERAVKVSRALFSR